VPDPLFGYLVVWLFGCLVIWLFGCLVIWLFGYLVVWLFGCLVIWLFGCCAPSALPRFLALQSWFLQPLHLIPPHYVDKQVLLLL
jgi:hypothetical protein